MEVTGSSFPLPPRPEGTPRGGGRGSGGVVEEGGGRPPPPSSSVMLPPKLVSTDVKTRRETPHQFTVADFLWGSVLGEGSYARVVHARLKKSGLDFAVKIMEKRHIRREKKVRQVLMEKNVMSRVSHEFIVKLWFSFQDTDSLYLVMDLVPGGELLDVIHDKRDEKTLARRPDEACDLELSRFYLAELVLALEYLHSEGVVHRDVKPENILVAADGHIKLTDFGTASWEPSEGGAVEEQKSNGSPRQNSFVGTAEYVSPEVLAGETATMAVDLWALGCILFQLMTGDRAFYGGSDYLTFQEIIFHCDGSRPLKYPPVLQGDASDLIQRLLVRNPAARLGAGPAGSENDYAALKRHAFFGDFDWEGILGVTPPYVPSSSSILTEEMRRDLVPGGDEDWMLEPEATPVPLELLSSSFSKAIADEEEECPEDSAWNQFLKPGERVVLTDLVWKRKGLSSRKRQLILTSLPRLLYVDAKAMELKGEVPWSSQLRPEVRNDMAFDVHTPARVYHFTVTDQEVVSAQRWEAEIQNLLGDVAPPPHTEGGGMSRSSSWSSLANIPRSIKKIVSGGGMSRSSSSSSLSGTPKR